MKTIGRNDPCPCGSGKKYKQCCMSSKKGNVSDLAAAFDKIYENNTWGNGSGPGSHPQATLEYRYHLEKFFYDHDIKSVVDFGCGDWQFTKYIHWGDIEYTGYDIAKFCIEQNNKLYRTDKIRFQRTPESYADLKEADLFISKDVFIHLPFAEIKDIMDNAFKKYKYMLITNSHPEVNVDIQPGQFRPIDIRLEPLSIPAELFLKYREHGIGNQAADKYVLLCRGIVH